MKNEDNGNVCSIFNVQKLDIDSKKDAMANYGQGVLLIFGYL